MPFANPAERDLHYAKHGHQFGAVDPLEYERLADDFLYGAMAVSTHECIRPDRIDRVRFDYGTHFEGVACRQPDFIRTFFAVDLRRVRRRGGEAGYFAYECGRVNP